MTLAGDVRGLIAACPHCGQRNRLAYAQLDRRAQCGNCRKPLAAPSAPVEISAAEQFDALVRESTLPLLVDFWATWCGPCRAVAPELEKLAAANAGRLLVAKVDTDRLSEIAARFRIQSIPTLVVFSGGSERTRIVGAQSAQTIERTIWAAVA